jgi:hypothetical protein
LTDTALVEKTEIDPLTGEGRCTHIIKQVPGKTPQALVMESRIDGIELEALCGHRFVAQRDPKQFPVCQKCEEIYFSKVPRDEGMPDE